MVWTYRNAAWTAVVEMWKCDLIFSPYLVPNDDFVDVVKLIPVFVLFLSVPKQRFKFWASRNCHIESFCSVKALFIEQVVVVFVCKVAQKLAREAIKIGHSWQRKPPISVRRPFYHACVLEGLVIVKPVENGVVLFFVKLDLNGLERLHIQNVVAVVQGGFFVVEGRKAHALEMPAVTFLAAHHNPHGAPLRGVNWLNDLGGLIDKRNGASDVIKDFYGPHLLPGHRNVFK
jgi:hypothetical protein